MLEFLFSSGVRVAELVQVTLGDISLEEGKIRIFGKGRKERNSFIGQQAWDIFGLFKGFMPPKGPQPPGMQLFRVSREMLTAGVFIGF